MPEFDSTDFPQIEGFERVFKPSDFAIDKLRKRITNLTIEPILRRKLRLTQRSRAFMYVYNMMIEREWIEEYGCGTRDDPKWVRCSAMAEDMEITQQKRLEATKARLEAKIAASPDRLRTAILRQLAAGPIPRRKLFRRLQYNKHPKFTEAYQSLLAANLIREEGTGTKDDSVILSLVSPSVLP